MKKLEAARTRLMLERPFIGALVMHLPLVANERTRRIATDARAIHYHPGFIERLRFEHVQFLLAHEALHCALLHFRRGGHRVRARWDRACDYAVNQLLVDDGMSPPPGVLLDAGYRGLAAESIYALLTDDPDEVSIDEHWFGDGATIAIEARTRAAAADDDFLAAHSDGLDELASRGDVGTLAYDWRERLGASALAADQAGRLGPNWQRALPDLVQPRLPWRALLARFVMSVARDDYSFQRPGRRGDIALLPGRSSSEANLVLALDTSGSIARADLLQFIDEIDALKGQIRAGVTLLACDAALAPGVPLRFEAWEPLALPDELGGGGGTRFTPVFDWVAQSTLRPDALLYFTDALGEFPDSPPEFPVLWLVKGNAPVPWGERVLLN